MEPFLIRALIASIGLAIVAAPLGCFVVWNRMSYFGETLAQACLIGVAIGLVLEVEPSLTVLAAALVTAFVILALGQQNFVPIDSILGLLHHGTLSAGVLATIAIAGPSIDLMSYLFGDLYAVTTSDLYVIYVGGVVVLAAMLFLWQPFLRVTVHQQLAEAEGINAFFVRTGFTILLAIVVAVTIKIVGVLLVIAFLVVPAIAARPLVSTPELMVVLSALAGALSVVVGISASYFFDLPGGPSIVLTMAIAAAVSVIIGQVRAHLTS